MKNGKKPNSTQRKLISKWGLDPQNWFVVKDTSDVMTIVHRHFDNQVRVIRKGDCDDN